MPSRRSMLGKLAVAAGIGAAGCTTGAPPGLPLDANPHSVPSRQFAQRDVLRRDADGNELQTRHRRILLLDLKRGPSEEAAETVERALRTVEAAYDWAPDGLFHTLAWGSRYFDDNDALGRVPIEHPEVLTRTDDEELQRFDAMLVLESDVQSHLSTAESALFGSRDELNGEAIEHTLEDVFRRRDHRTGFLGEGLPAEHVDVEGLEADAPMFSGFFSGREGSQASEDRVAIEDGPLAGGTTAHLSHITFDLPKWFSFDEGSRVEKMFSPEFTVEDVADLGTDVPFADAVREHGRDHGSVGHHEKVARVRRDGEPLILRRDFNTVDHGRTGVHFLSYQRKLAHFRRTRKSMNGWYLRDDHPDITDRENNGILDFISTQSRANFVVPPREKRAFPLTIT
ncbi:DUF7405 family protein [Halobaculum rarum]|uniref:DUF7405 family protein n=1 Tax=Halobaculum rarum TaxID=3075122 RepID=UPI0032AFC3B2